MIEIRPVEAHEAFEQIEALAEKIWTEHYTPIIGAEQVRYMLKRFQSVEAMLRQCREEGYRYIQAVVDGALAGYCAFARPDAETIFLSKVYVDSTYRGRGLADAMIRHSIAECPGAKTMILTVNKHNAGAIAAYRKMGFAIVEELCTDIGGGFFMDDYKMERSALT